MIINCKQNDGDSVEGSVGSRDGGCSSDYGDESSSDGCSDEGDVRRGGDYNDDDDDDDDDFCGCTYADHKDLSISEM